MGVVAVSAAKRDVFYGEGRCDQQFLGIPEPYRVQIGVWRRMIRFLEDVDNVVFAEEKSLAKHIDTDVLPAVF